MPGMKNEALSNLILCKTVSHSACMKSSHPAAYISICEVYLHVICLRRQCGSVFSLTALAIISYDRIKLS